jgi:triacylglycerol lipase
MVKCHQRRRMMLQLAAGGPRCAIARGLHEINACLIGSNVDGVVLAFRGTLPPDGPNHEQIVLDWFNDFHAELISVPHLPGKVHAGFWKSFDSLWTPLLAELMPRLKTTGAVPKLYITGHSKGGGMAPIAAMRLALEEGVISTVRTFAVPHPGDEDFAAAYNAKITDSIRYEFADDIVSHVPPSLAFKHMFAAVPFFQLNPAVADRIRRFDLNYTSVGRLQYINRDGSLVDDSPTLRFKRFESLVRLLAEGGFKTIVDDHSSRCGGGYMSGICPSEVCG